MENSRNIHYFLNDFMHQHRQHQRIVVGIS